MDDLQLIQQSIGYYADGGTNGQPEIVAKAFHPSAYMKFVKDGILVDVPINEYFNKYISVGALQERVVTVNNIDLTGSAASAKLTIDYTTHQFIDYLNFLKIDGRWLIVSKIFYRKIKAKKMEQ